MSANGTRKLFVNLAVKDPARSMEFFKKLGFEFNLRFTDANAACMVINEDASCMLLKDQFFQTFTKRTICDTSMQTEALLAISCNSREEVDAMVQEAVASGGQRATEPADHGFMYVSTFYDLDGHHWEVMWMDPNAEFPPNQ